MEAYQVNDFCNAVGDFLDATNKLTAKPSAAEAHKQRVFDILKHLADSVQPDGRWVSPCGVIERAESLVAEYEKRIKEKEGGE